MAGPHACPHVGCDKSFSRPEKLDRHLMDHCGEVLIFTFNRRTFFIIIV